MTNPLFEPIRAIAEKFAGFTEWPMLDDYNAVVEGLVSIRFGHQPPKRTRRKRQHPLNVSALYDVRICKSGWVPTRERNWHDFLNMLVWATFPSAKQTLHERQYRALVAQIDPLATTLPGKRTREQDGLAILDEGGLLLLCEESLFPEMDAALSSRQTDRVHQAIGQGQAVAVLFGHALYESLVVGGPPVCAMVHLLRTPSPLPTAWPLLTALADQALGSALKEQDSFCHPETFRSLPICNDLAALHPSPTSHKGSRVCTIDPTLSHYPDST